MTMRLNRLWLGSVAVVLASCASVEKPLQRQLPTLL